MLEFLNTNLSELATYLVDANKRIFVLYLLSALVLAVPVYWLQRQKDVNHLSGFFKFVFPKRVWLDKSALVDYQLFISNKFIKALLFGYGLLTMVPIALGTTEVFEAVFGVFTPMQWSPSTIIFCFTILLFILDDFTRYFLHWLLHKIPFLWDFHKVHHSASVLTPFTIYRSHPVENFLYACRMAIAQGLAVGIGYYFFGATLKMYDILGANAFVFIFNVMGANLRHSHIWLSWGDKIESWFISPAQHQIHHSASPEHYDTNLGSALAIWDKLAGSLIKASQVKQPLTLGAGKYDKGHNSLIEVYLKPFQDNFQRIKKKVTRLRSNYINDKQSKGY